MKIGMRTPNFKKTFKARTTGKVKRQLKSSVNPLYGKNGMGLLNDPKKSIYNKIYNKTSVDALENFRDTDLQRLSEIPKKINLKWKDDDGNIINIDNYLIKFKKHDEEIDYIFTDDVTDIFIKDNILNIYSINKNIEIKVPKSIERKVYKFIWTAYDIDVSIFEIISVTFRLIVYIAMLIIVIAFLILTIYFTFKNT